MKTRIATSLLAAASLAAFAEDPAAPAAELEEDSDLPEIALGADWCTRQISRGLPDALDEVRALQPAEVYHDIAKGFHARRKQLADA